MMPFGIKRKPAAMLAVLLLCLWIASSLRAQDRAGSDEAVERWEVFVKVSEESAAAELVYFNVLTGETRSVSSNGERFTLVDDGVIYFDRAEKRVKFSTPDGRVSDHSFMTMPADALRIDWVTAEDGQSIAWTVTHREPDNRLLTRTFIADADGGDVREALRDGPWIDSRVLPIAFNAEGDELYMDAHPDGIGEFLPYSIHANLFGLDLVDGTMRPLPVEPGCFCPTAIGDELLLQLTSSSEFGGVQVQLGDISGGAARIIPAIRYSDFTSAGNLLPSPDERLAVYALAQERSIVNRDAIPQSIFVLADLEAMEQSIVGEPIDGLVFPFSWSEDNAAVLFTDESESRTWKLDLASGSIREVAEARYLGRLDI